MTDTVRARLTGGTLAALWLLALLLAWLLLPLPLGLAGLLQVLWYATGWIAVVLVFLIPVGITVSWSGR